MPSTVHVVPDALDLRASRILVLTCEDVSRATASAALISKR
jgi:hypothetical protein